MYLNLEAEFKRKNVKRADIAAVLDCNISTVVKKMAGDTQFTFVEVCKIKKFLGVDIPLETLFEFTEPNPVAA